VVGRSHALPPGTILQLMYLEERLKAIVPGHFVEIGPGAGEITKRLLAHGWTGVVCDLEPITIERLKQRFTDAIAASRLHMVTEDFLSTPRIADVSVDLVISCMVMEHVEDEAAFMQAARRVLKPHGRMIGLVPSSPNDWGIEDDIAGHLRRYTRESLKTLMAAHRWNITHVAGLTFPISNLLLPLSNFLVNRAERSKLALSTLERTKQSGHRAVKFKTSFPSIATAVLNETVMMPLHWLQKACTKAPRALVLYFEASYEQ